MWIPDCARRIRLASPLTQRASPLISYYMATLASLVHTVSRASGLEDAVRADAVLQAFHSFGIRHPATLKLALDDANTTAALHAAVGDAAPPIFLALAKGALSDRPSIAGGAWRWGPSISLLICVVVATVVSNRETTTATTAPVIQRRQLSSVEESTRSSYMKKHSTSSAKRRPPPHTMPRRRLCGSPDPVAPTPAAGSATATITPGSLRHLPKKAISGSGVDITCVNAGDPTAKTFTRICFGEQER